ncbi:MAG: type II secretion system protein GspK [Planctomycetota bacterium]|jgi:type II secretory pathway pseudopilin PulG
MMKLNPKKTKIKSPAERPSGFVLLVTVIVLVVLASLTTGLAVQMSMAKRRQSYMIEYQRARYGLDSAMKYILNTLPAKNFILAQREGDPDFSDVFLMNQAEFAEFIATWAATATDEQIEAVLREGASLTEPAPLSTGDMLSGLIGLFGGGSDGVSDVSVGSYDDANDTTTDPYDADEELYVVELDPNDVVVPGPYGASWPYVTEPIDLEIGPCQITVTIEDENAKMPLSWLVTNSKEANKQAENALKTFCEWMSWDRQQLHELETAITEAMDEIHGKKAFTLNPGPILLKSTTTRAARTPARTSRSRRRTSRRTASRTVRSTTTQKRPAVAHTTDFAKLFHSSLLDQELLARPLPDTGERIESPLKYLSLWGSQRVNINTAPRHVLEAAFSLAMDSFDLPEFVQEVITQRKEKPFQKIDELKELGGLDADTMKNLNNYLTTTSTFFQVRITSRSGGASSSAVATVVKEGRNTQQLVILYEQ